MTESLTDLFKKSNGDLIIRAGSTLLGESAQSIKDSLDVILPSVLGAMVMKNLPGSIGVNPIDFISANALEQIEFNPEHTEHLFAKGTNTLNYLFDRQLVPLVDKIASTGGLKTSSASTLLKIVAPLFLGFVGKTVKDLSLSVNSTQELLFGQFELAKQELPKDLVDVIGYPPQDDSQKSAMTNHEIKTTNPPTGLSKLLPWIILLIASLGLFYFMEKGCNASTRVDKMPQIEKRDTLQ